MRRHTDGLRHRPVWFVSSGPLDDSASAGAIPAVRQVAKLMQDVGARGQMTFGGRLEPDAKGFPAERDGQEARRRLARPGARPGVDR